MCSAASFLIRRRRALQLLEPLRCFSTLTLTGGYDSSIKEERIPKQGVFSRDRDGILFSIPNKNPTGISGIDPTHLPLPSTASLPLKEGKTVLSPEFIEDGKGPNFVVSSTHHDSFLIRRRRSRHCLYPWRSFSTQAQDQNLARDDADSSKERARRRRVPMLMVFSRYQSPQSCSGLLSLSRSIENGKDRNFLKFEQEISLPEASADKSLCIGSSEGILFTIPKEIPTEMSAVDPLTGAHLPLPSTSALPTTDTCFYLTNGKAILSPSRDMVILSHDEHVYFARLGDEGFRCWTELPNDFGFMHDAILHKGLLYALAFEGLVGIYDLNKPSWPTLTGSRPLPYDDDLIDRDCLVESPDGKGLFLVSRRTYPIKVFKLSQRGNWTRVRSIGDMAIFVGINQSVALPASHFPDILKPNSIYFTGRHFNDALSMKPFAGVFSLEDKSIQFFELTNGQELCHRDGIPPPVWFMPSTSC